MVAKREGYTLPYHMRLHAGITGGGYSEEQEALFEYLQAHNATITARRQGDASVSMVHSVGEELHVHANLCVDHNGHVRCPLFTSLRAAKEDVGWLQV